MTWLTKFQDNHLHNATVINILKIFWHITKHYVSNHKLPSFHVSANSSSVDKGTLHNYVLGKVRDNDNDNEI